ncbi:hypothetical protein Tco_0388766 [Tanacetum coccineum]
MHFRKASPFGLVSMYCKNRDRHCAYRPVASIGIPCVHSVAAYLFLNKVPDEGVDHWYCQDRWFEAYQFSINLIYGSNIWKKQPNKPLLPPIVVRMPCRPRKNRVKAKSKNNSQEQLPKPPQMKKQPGRNREPNFNSYASNRGGGRGSRGGRDSETEARMKHTNRRVRIPKGLYPRRIEEKLTKKQVGGEWIIEREMPMISKDGTISKFPKYHSSEEEEPTEQPRALNKYGFVDHLELQRNEFASHRLPQQEGNMNGWLIEDEDEPLEHEASDRGGRPPGGGGDPDPESTASSKPMLKKIIKAIPDRMFHN